MASLTLTLPDERLRDLERSAWYHDVPVEQYVYLRLGWSVWNVPPRSMHLTLVLPKSEVKEWDVEAKRRRMTVEEWVRRMGNFVVSTGVASGLEAPVGQVVLTTLLTRCEWCETELPGQSTIRRRFCSDRCRVSAWRGRRRHVAAD